MINNDLYIKILRNNLLDSIHINMTNTIHFPYHLNDNFHSEILLKAIPSK